MPRKLAVQRAPWNPSYPMASQLYTVTPTAVQRLVNVTHICMQMGPKIIAYPVWTGLKETDNFFKTITNTKTVNILSRKLGDP